MFGLEISKVFITLLIAAIIGLLSHENLTNPTEGWLWFVYVSIYATIMLTAITMVSLTFINLFTG